MLLMQQGIQPQQANGQRLSAARHFWIANGAVTVYPFDASDLGDMAKPMQTYTEWPRTEMDFADATLVWLAAQTQINRIMTMHVRDFSRYRLPDGRRFEIF